MAEIKNQRCPICKKKTLTIREVEEDIPYFGKTYIFSMDCSECGFKKSDIESAERKEPSKYEIEIDSKEDMKIRIIKSSQAIIKWPNLRITIEPGIDSFGSITNVEGLLDDAYHVLEFKRETESDASVRKKTWKLMDKILDIKEGKIKTRLIIEDATGNSAIISQKAKKSPLKKKK